MLVSRALLHKRPGETMLPKELLLNRSDRFQRGEWQELLAEARAQAPGPHTRATPGQRGSSSEARVTRAQAYVELGEISSARQALTAEEIAPGTEDTLNRLRNPERRLQHPRAPLPQEVLDFRPPSPPTMALDKFLKNLRSSKRGAASGPSGTTAEHLQVVLDDEPCSALLHEAANHLAQADVPPEIAQAIRLGRMTALRKRDGGVRGIVVGDMLRRLVARTFAQESAGDFEAACAPYQYALSTRAGTECIAHIFQAVTEASPSTTILSIDGIGAYDLISRGAMLQSLAAVPRAAAVLPFTLLFYGQPSEYMWYDAQGQGHSIIQAEGGEQGDPLMPALFALGQHSTLQAVQQSLQDGEALFAFLDDVYAICRPERARPIFDRLEAELQAQCGIGINLGKTRVWNRAGLEPAGFDGMGAPEQPVWTGGANIPPEQRGIKVLGTPLGSPEFVARQMQDIRAEHDLLLAALREMPELQSSWLLLSMCASTRANYYLRALPPSQSRAFAESHDQAMLNTLFALLDHPDGEREDVHWARMVAQLPLRLGGLGLRSAVRVAPAAYWASWADCLEMIQRRHPVLAAMFTNALSAEAPSPAPCLHELQQGRVQLRWEGYHDCPSWADLARGVRPRQPEGEPGEWAHGWQFYAAGARDEFARAALMQQRSLRGESQALLRSQSGPCGGKVFTVLPTSTLTTIPSAEMRVLLLRRLHLPIPLMARLCRCRRPLDACGHHRAACSTCGILHTRGKPLEKAAARVCREAGARVAENVLLQSMNLPGISGHDGRQIEVVANCLPLFGGAQLAVDTTLVSPVRRDGTPQPRAAGVDGVQLLLARRRKERKCQVS